MGDTISLSSLPSLAEIEAVLTDVINVAETAEKFDLFGSKVQAVLKDAVTILTDVQTALKAVEGV